MKTCVISPSSFQGEGRLRLLCFLVMMIAVVCGVTACGNKGKLKSPTQMELAAAKKAKKAQQEESPAGDSPSAASPAAESSGDVSPATVSGQ